MPVRQFLHFSLALGRSAISKLVTEQTNLTTNSKPFRGPHCSGPMGSIDGDRWRLIRPFIWTFIGNRQRSILINAIKYRRSLHNMGTVAGPLCSTAEPHGSSGLGQWKPSGSVPIKHDQGEIKGPP